MQMRPGGAARLPHQRDLLAQLHRVPRRDAQRAAVGVQRLVAPGMYAWVNIYANWDPYGNTGGVKIAVVSNDQDYVSTEDGVVHNVGNDVIKSLKATTSIGWQFMGLALLPCLYSWFNIISNWDPYGSASTSNIKIAVVTEDVGVNMLGLNLNIGDSVVEGLHSNTTIGWQFPADKDTALEGVYSGKYYAALVVPENFTEDLMGFMANSGLSQNQSVMMEVPTEPSQASLLVTSTGL